MDLALVGSQMSSDASCGESSVREGAGYDEAFGSGHESEDFSLSSGRGTLARSPDGNESCIGEDVTEMIVTGIKATERRKDRKSVV